MYNMLTIQSFDFNFIVRGTLWSLMLSTDVYRMVQKVPVDFLQPQKLVLGEV